MKTLLIAAALTCLGPTGPPPAPAPSSPVREFRIDDAWGRDTVEFRTSAAMEEIVGTTNRVQGVLRADPSHLKSPATFARVEVLLDSLKTGIAMRDGHVAKALGADKAPKAIFTVASVRSASRDALEPNVPSEIEGEGTLDLNGRRRAIPFTASVTFVPRGGPFNEMRPGNFVKLVARFDVALEDFGIERKGSVLPLQVAPTAHVTLTALGSDATPEEAVRYRQSAVRYLGKAVN